MFSPAVFSSSYHLSIYPNRPEEVTAAFKALEDAQRTLREECNRAMEIQAETSALEVLSMKERWRIPIVVARVAKNRRLSGADSRIWAAVSRNMTTQEAVEKLTRATLRPPVPRSVVPAAGSGASAVASNNNNNGPNASTTLIGRVFAIRSNRLFAPTVSSQNRFSAEEVKPKGKTLRKYFERERKHSNASPAHSHSQSQGRTTIPNSIHKSTHITTQANEPASTNATTYPTAKTPKKSFRRGTRHPKHKPRSKQTDAAQEEQKGGDFDPEEEDENAVSLVDHLSTGLATLAATVSSKFNKSSRVHSASADEADSFALSTGSAGNKTFRENNETPENTLEKQALQAHLASQAASYAGKSPTSVVAPQIVLLHPAVGASAGLSTSVSVGAGATAMAVRRSSQHNHNTTAGACEEEKSEMSIGLSSSPSKARAFFAPFLASLSRKNTNTHLMLSTSPGKGLDASRGASSKESPNAPASHSTPSSQISPKPSPMRSLGSMNTFFGATLGRLMSWSASAPNNQVVPAQ